MNERLPFGTMLRFSKSLLYSTPGHWTAMVVSDERDLMLMTISNPPADEDLYAMGEVWPWVMNRNAWAVLDD